MALQKERVLARKGALIQIRGGAKLKHYINCLSFNLDNVVTCTYLYVAVQAFLEPLIE